MTDLAGLLLMITVLIVMFYGTPDLHDRLTTRVPYECTQVIGETK